MIRLLISRGRKMMKCLKDKVFNLWTMLIDVIFEEEKGV